MTIVCVCFSPFCVKKDSTASFWRFSTGSSFFFELAPRLRKGNVELDIDTEVQYDQGGCWMTYIELKINEIWGLTGGRESKRRENRSCTCWLRCAMSYATY
jgi:hypothetical protein